MMGPSETIEAHVIPVARSTSLAHTVDNWLLSCPSHWTASALLLSSL